MVAGPMIPAAHDADAPARRYCVRHPSRETLVACGRCERPFCTECLIHTPAGQRCYECAGVRRNAAERMALTRVVQAAAVVLIGSAISALAGFFALLIGAITGNIAGNILSPVVTRRTRTFMFVLAAVILIAGALFGWSLGLTLRITSAGAGRNLPFLAVFLTVPFMLVQNWMFWVFVCIAGFLGYQRMR